MLAFDRKVFPISDRFPPTYWTTLTSYWMLVDGVKAGCCAFQKHIDLQEDLRPDHFNPAMKGSLYIASTGILPRFQGRGLGTLMKAWQICYARRHGFNRIVTNTRKRNTAMIRLNKKFGFKVLRTTRAYYCEPTDSTVVMELRLTGSPI